MLNRLIKLVAILSLLAPCLSFAVTVTVINHSRFILNLAGALPKPLTQVPAGETVAVGPNKSIQFDVDAPLFAAKFEYDHGNAGGVGYNSDGSVLISHSWTSCDVKPKPGSDKATGYTFTIEDK